MKPVYAIILVAAALLLTACTFTLASDITPPPDYVSPTPMPTLGALVPPAPPDVQQGAAIFAQNCAACHGDKGLGDGPQSMQLPVTVPGIGLEEVAREASPAEWYKTVTQGNLDRFMPPFVGALSDQQRWDVVAYALTLHATNKQVAEGKQLFQANCPDCASSFTNQARMASLSEKDLVQLMKNGEGSVPAFGNSFTDEQAHAVAAYLRTLTFAAGAELASAPTATLVVTGTPEAATTPVAGTPGTPAPAPTGGTAAAGTGTITGTVQMGSGAQLPTSLNVTLRGFDHGQDQSTGPQEVLTLSATAGADGSYTLDGVEMAPNRIFLAEVEYSGLKYRSGFAAVQANASTLALPPVKLYEKTDDFSLLKLNQVHIYTDFATAGTAQILEIFAFTNSSDRAVVISTDGSTIPFIKLPANAENVGYEAGQDSAPFVAADKGLAVVPSDTPYSIIAFFTLPYDKKLEVSQPLATDAASVILLIPDGMKLSGTQLTDRGQQVIQNNNYHEYSSSELKAGQTLDFSISGSPRTSSATGLDTRQITMIAGGSLGLLLILAGAVLYFRDRKRVPQVPEGSGFDSPEEVMDAILALDDLRRAGKISDEAYHKRRADLKEILRGTE
jgi:mono/diheme cytochrome c family protein